MKLRFLTLAIPMLLCAQQRVELGEPIEIEHEEMRCGYIFDRYPDVYVPNNLHSIIGVSALGDTLELEDGSQWKVSYYDQYKVQFWRTNDPLMLTQNSRWFSSYNYRIINRNGGASVEVNPFLGPYQNGENTLFITDIDLVRGVIKLTDNTHWEVCAKDRRVFDQWYEDQAVIVGHNSGSEEYCEALLINFNTLSHVRAHQF